MIVKVNVENDTVQILEQDNLEPLLDNNDSSKEGARIHTEDGKVVADGVPVTTDTSDKLWSAMSSKMVAKNVIDKPGR